MQLSLEISTQCTTLATKFPKSVEGWVRRNGVLVQAVPPLTKSSGGRSSSQRVKKSKDLPVYLVPIQSITVVNPNEASLHEWLLFSPSVCAQGQEAALATARDSCRRYGFKDGATAVYGVETLTGLQAWHTIAKAKSRFCGIRVRYDPLATHPVLRRVPAYSAQAETPADANDADLVTALVTSLPPNSQGMMPFVFRLLLGDEISALKDCAEVSEEDKLLFTLAVMARQQLFG